MSLVKTHQMGVRDCAKKPFLATAMEAKACRIRQSPVLRCELPAVNQSLQSDQDFVYTTAWILVLQLRVLAGTPAIALSA